MRNVLEYIRAWWNGDFYNPSLEEILDEVHYDKPRWRPWPARAWLAVCRFIGEFSVREWIALFGIVVAAAVALFIHFDRPTEQQTAAETYREEAHQ